MPTFTASQILEENGYTTADFATFTVEYLVDNAIDYVNLETGRSITNMAGVAGSKTANPTSEENAVLKMVISMMLRETKKTSLSNSSSTSGSSSTSKSVSLGSISVSEGGSTGTAISAAAAINNASNTFYYEAIMRGLQRLREIEVSVG